MFLKCTGMWGAGDGSSLQPDLYYYDTVNNLWVWSDATNYYMSALPGTPIKINGLSQATIYPSGYQYDSYNWYYLDGYGYYIWKQSGGPYVISRVLGAGLVEMEYPTGTWTGDQWWSLTSGGVPSPVGGIYTPRGQNKLTGSTYTIVPAQIVGRFRARNNGIVGVYTPVVGSGLVGNKYLGLLTYSVSWMDGIFHTGTFTQNFPDYASHSQFDGCDNKYLWYDLSSANYIISFALGVKDALLGYWQSSSLAGIYTRVFSPATTPPAPDTYTLVFYDYVLGTKTYPVYLSQEAIWLS